MKKTFLKAFTLIELIIVITIITFITTSSVFYFLDFVKNQEIKQRIEIIENNIKQLDSDIKKYKIFDYELSFNTWNFSWAYIIYLNKFDNKYNQTIDFNTTTWSWIIITNTSSWTWIIKIFKKQKLFIAKEYDSSSNFEFDFNKADFYKIKATLSWETLNDININYFSDDNINPSKNNNLDLIKISETKDWSDIWNIKIKNIWWKKIITDWTNKYNKIYLLFENNWKQKFIKITTQ